MSRPLPEVLAVRPFQHPARGQALIPGSKSLTNRALLLAALGEGRTRLTGALFSEDTALMAQALRSLGFAVEEDPPSRTLVIGGLAGRIPAPGADLFVGLAGTAARFLTALVAAAPSGVFRLDGTAQMRRRPMKGLIDALRTLGADVRCPAEEGHFPLEVHARGLRGGSVALDASESSQMLSALLMVAPLAAADVEILLSSRVREPFVQMTAGLMGLFGAGAAFDPAEPRRLRVRRGGYRTPGRGVSTGPGPDAAPLPFAIEPDATAASYFAALPLVTGGRVGLTGLLPAGRSLQGDIRFLDVLTACGVRIEAGGGGLSASFERGARGRGADTDFSGFSDTFLTLAALAPLLEGRTRIRGIAHTRKQETDRVSGMAGELRRLGQEVLETEDSLEIIPRPLRPDQTVETHGDHRFAMSFGVLGSLDLRGDGSPWLSLRNPSCCAKTFPDFFEVLDGLRENPSG